MCISLAHCGSHIVVSCGLLVCQHCSSPSLHTAECSLLQQVSFLGLQDHESVHSLVSVARLLLSEGWDQLEGNTGIRVGTQAWEVIENFVVPVLMRIKGKDGSSTFTKVFWSCHIDYFNSCIREHIHHAAGVLDTNCFEHKRHLHNGGAPATMRCLYSQASRLNNSCVPNCTKEFSGYSIEIYTSR